MEEACVSDAQRMKKCIESLKAPDIDEGMTVTLLEDLEAFLENLDNARDFQNLEGYQFITTLLHKTESQEVRLACLSLLGTASQNQPTVQKILMDAKVLPTLVDSLRTTKEPTFQARLLRCISSMISGYNPAEQSFLFLHGLNVLKTILFEKDSAVPVIRKCLFLLNQLLHSQAAFLVMALLDSEV